MREFFYDAQFNPDPLIFLIISAMTDAQDDDAALFRAAMAGVRRKPAGAHVSQRGGPVSARPRQSEIDEQEVLRELLLEPDPESLESGDTLAYRMQGVQDSVFRKLRRGQYAIQSELDLHGLNREAARLEVVRFLAHCQDRGLRCVRIIHGKGNRSPNSGPVIKTLIDSWLRRRQDVVAFCSARPVDGGTGAVYVLLRSPGRG